MQGSDTPLSSGLVYCTISKCGYTELTSNNSYILYNKFQLLAEKKSQAAFTLLTSLSYQLPLSCFFSAAEAIVQE